MITNLERPSDSSLSTLLEAENLIIHVLFKHEVPFKAGPRSIQGDTVITAHRPDRPLDLEEVIEGFDRYFEDNIKDEPAGRLFRASLMDKYLHYRGAGIPFPRAISHRSWNEGWVQSLPCSATLPHELSDGVYDEAWLRERLNKRKGSWAERSESIIHDTFSAAQSRRNSIFHTAIVADLLGRLISTARYGAKTTMAAYIFDSEVTVDSWFFRIGYALKRVHRAFTKTLNMHPEMPAAIAECIGAEELSLPASNRSWQHEDNPTLWATMLAYNIAIASGSDPIVMLNEKILEHVPDESQDMAMSNMRRYAARRKLVEFNMCLENKQLNVAAAETVSEEDEFIIYGMPTPSGDRSSRRLSVVRNVSPAHKVATKLHMLISYEDEWLLGDGILINDDELKKLCDSRDPISPRLEKMPEIVEKRLLW